MSSREPTEPRTAVTVSAHAGQDGPSGEAPVRIGRYLLAGPIGRGGMGVVYLARDEVLGRRVALKLLDSGAAMATQQARLLLEAQALARLAHPNVVTVHEAGEHAGRIFLAMEFVPGDTLRAWQRERERDRAELLAVAMQAGRGLAAAHDAGLVHRDVKPDNIMVGVDGRVRVMDFGLARLARTLAGDDDELASPASPGPLTQVGAVIGTPGYMAPEQRRGAVVDTSGDIYSFCVVLYELLAGERPGREAPQAVLVRRGVPAWLAAVVVRGLLDDPTARWPTMHALLDALEQDPIARRRRRLRIAGIIALTGLVVTALVLGGLAWRASILRARVEQVAADRLTAIGQVEDPEAAFAAFVADPAHRGTRAVAQAWQRRGDEARAAGRGDEAIAAYARAYVDAAHPDDVTATLRSLAAATHANGDGPALAPVVAELRARGVDDDELRAQSVFAALALRDLPGALAETPADSPWRPLLAALAAGHPHPKDLLSPAYALPPGGRAAYAVGSASGETVLLDDRLAEVGRRPFGEYHLIAGTTRKVVRGTDLVDLDAPDVILWRAEHLVAYGAALRPGPGRPPVFVFQYLWPHLGFYRLVEEPGQPLSAAVAHAGTHAADAAWETAWSGDLDGDGREELVASFQNTYDLRVFDLDDEGALRLRWRGPAGYVVGIAGARRGDERLVAVVRDALHALPSEYPEPPHLGGPAGFELLRWDGEALRPVAHVPLPHPDIPVSLRTLLAADLDGDGDDELLQGFRRGEDHGLLLAQLSGDGGETRMIGGLSSLLVVQSDDDPADELVVRLQPEGGTWVLGDGEAAMPAVPPGRGPGATFPVDDPWLAERTIHAEALAGMGRAREAAGAYADLARMTADPDVRGRVLARAAALWSAVGDDEQVLAIDAHLADDPRLGAAALARSVAALDRLARHVEAHAAAVRLAEHPARSDAEAAQAAAQIARLEPLVRPGARLDVDFADLGRWHVERPAGLRRGAERGELALTAVGPAPAAWLPLEWDGEALALEVELDADRLESGACLSVEVQDETGTALVGTRVCGGAGPSALNRDLSCSVGGDLPFTQYQRDVPSARSVSRHVARAGWFRGGEVTCSAGGRRVARPAPPTTGPLRLVIGAMTDVRPTPAEGTLRRVTVLGARAGASMDTDAWDRAARHLAAGDAIAARDVLEDSIARTARERLILVDMRDRLGDVDGLTAAIDAAAALLLAPAHRPDLALLIRTRPLAAAVLQRRLGGRLLPALSEVWSVLPVHRNDRETRQAALRELAGVGDLVPQNHSEADALAHLLLVRGLLSAAEGLPDMAERDLAAVLALGDDAPNDDLVELHAALARLWIAERPAVARAHAQTAVRRSSDPERTRERLLRELALAGLLAGPT
ncbi:serine/threonine-protein kinase [Nannocystis sp. RBIL2]|uniref:serine/threonine-protein kinase n=1 Tax=Nannocystis sp. RBIL2 TaxID=2996788 RepID=UPI00226E91F8|nr:serine/threonine-protein kinase [Nannocystis sp. RBIL2]MCY1066763.1 serine/threonine-protein kinase [Nannocystis sp. RBIL2]